MRRRCIDERCGLQFLFVDMGEGVRLQRMMAFGVMDACKRYFSIRNQGWIARLETRLKVLARP